MTVFKHKRTGSWIAQVTEGGRKRQVGSFPTQREARAAERDALAAAPSSRMTVAAWRGVWLQSPHWEEGTRQHNTERTARFADEFGHRRLRDINRTDARRWLDVNPSTIPAVSAMFGAASYEDDEHGNALLTENPFSKLAKQKKARRDLRPDWLHDEDIVGLQETAVLVHGESYGPAFAGLIRFAAETGMRPGELFALRSEDIDEQAGEVYVRRAAKSKTRTIGLPKNKLTRSAILTPAAADAARAARLFEDQTLAFTTPTGKQLWQPSHSLLWKPVRIAAGRESMDFYELRHYCATRLLEAGATDADVAVALGHTDGGELVRRVYGHPAERHSLDRVRKILDDESEAA